MLATAIVVLAIITVLIGAAVTVSLQDSTSTEHDSNVKASLATAEAGLQAVTYRLDKVSPKPTYCLNEAGKESEAKLCESGVEQLSNNATFKYWMSKELASTESCAGETPTLEKGFVYRCVTAEAKVNGVSPATRVQALLKSSIGESLFQIKGILGLEEVLVNGAVKASAITASNKLIKGEGSAAFSQGFEICPGGKFIPAAGTERLQSGVTVGGVGGEKANPAYEITRSASKCPITQTIPAEHATAASNEDSRISSGLDARTENTKGAVEFTGAPNYELALSSSGTLTLSGSRYYFCRVTIGNSSKLIIPSKAKVEIFIDSHADGCPEYTGKKGEVPPVFELSGAAQIENLTGAAGLLLEVASENPVKILASGNIVGSIYAPNTEVVINGKGEIKGAIVGKKVHLEAGSFNYSEEIGSIVIDGSNAIGYSRVRWRQCAAGTTGSSC